LFHQKNILEQNVKSETGCDFSAQNDDAFRRRRFIKGT
jgi:hypothetical protein